MRRPWRTAAYRRSAASATPGRRAGSWSWLSGAGREGRGGARGGGVRGGEGGGARGGGPPGGPGASGGPGAVGGRVGGEKVAGLGGAAQSRVLSCGGGSPPRRPIINAEPETRNPKPNPITKAIRDFLRSHRGVQAGVLTTMPGG